MCGHLLRLLLVLRITLYRIYTAVPNRNRKKRVNEGGGEYGMICAINHVSIIYNMMGKTRRKGAKGG